MSFDDEIREPFEPRDRVADLIAVLLIAGEGSERRAVQRALDVTPGQLNQIIRAAVGSVPGLVVQEHENTLRLITHPDSAAAVHSFLQSPNAIRLSPASIETLAVIAYSESTTRAQIQDARGVNSDGPIATLLQHGLILEVGRAEGPGRPALFAITADCLTLLGLSSRDELPPLTGAPQVEKAAVKDEGGVLVPFPGSGRTDPL